MNNSILEKSMNQGANKDLSIIMGPDVSIVKEKEDHSFIMVQSKQDKR